MKNYAFKFYIKLDIVVMLFVGRQHNEIDIRF